MKNDFFKQASSHLDKIWQAEAKTPLVVFPSVYNKQKMSYCRLGSLSFYENSNGEKSVSYGGTGFNINKTPVKTIPKPEQVKIDKLNDQIHTLHIKINEVLKTAYKNGQVVDFESGLETTQKINKI